MPKFSKILLLVASVVLVLTVFLGVDSQRVDAASNGQDGAYRQINVYSEVLRHIQTDYVVDPNIPAVTNGALRGLLESLDADSSYLTPEEYKAYKARQGRQGAGGDQRLQTLWVCDGGVGGAGSPADKAGLADGDILEAIGTQDTREISLAMIHMLLEGKPGSEVTISVVKPRKATPEKVSMTRLAECAPVAETMYENSTILYLKPRILDHDHVNRLRRS